MAATIHQKISPMFWFDNQAEEAARFYTSAFPNSQIDRITRYGKAGFEVHGQQEGTVMTIDFLLDGQRFTALNGGPHVKINPSISFFVTYELASDVDGIWKHLAAGGSILMPLDKYAWSDKYGWVEDRYGISWQIALGKKRDVNGQSIIPSLLFVNEQHGKAEEAIHFYTSIFENSTIMGIVRYGAGELPEKEGTVKHAQFTLGTQTFMAMDSALGHVFGFNEAMSFVVHCGTQQEVDYYWEKLGAGGNPDAQQCGWLKDKFGVSWQVVPVIIEEMLQSSNSGKTERVTKAYLEMKKFDIAALERAFEGI
jgi:predicted 3-demethylubiquinone-9 3-methyltransferase (glyoxalase superfamily)